MDKEFENFVHEFKCLSEKEKINVWENLKKEIYELHPINQPVNKVMWIPIDRVSPNENKNNMSGKNTSNTYKEMNRDNKSGLHLKSIHELTRSEIVQEIELFRNLANDNRKFFRSRKIVNNCNLQIKKLLDALKYHEVEVLGVNRIEGVDVSNIIVDFDNVTETVKKQRK